MIFVYLITLICLLISRNIPVGLSSVTLSLRSSVRVDLKYESIVVNVSLTLGTIAGSTPPSILGVNLVLICSMIDFKPVDALFK